MEVSLKFMTKESQKKFRRLKEDMAELFAIVLVKVAGHEDAAEFLK